MPASMNTRRLEGGFKMKIFTSARQFLSGTKNDSKSKPPYLLSIRSSTTLIILTVSLAIFTDIFYYALIVPVIPFSLTVQVGIAEDQVQSWTSILIACYSVALFIGSPAAGIYADHTSSRRWPLLLGLVALAASTLLLCFGNSIGLLVVGRILQGLSAAIVWSVGCALLVDTMKSNVGVAMGYVSVAMSVGLLIAPVIGGSVYAAAGYYAVYYIAFGVVVLDVLLRLVMIEKKVARQWIEEDESSSPSEAGTGRVDIEAGTSPTTTTSREGYQNSVKASEIHNPTEPSPTDYNQLQQGNNEEKRIETASMTNHDSAAHSEGISMWCAAKSLLKSTRLFAALYCLVVESGLMMGFDATLALFVQRTFQWNSTAAGIMFLAIFVPGFISPLVGWLADKYGARWLCVFGFCLLIPLLVCLRFVTENSIGHKVLLCVLLAISGIALAFANVPLMAEITYVIEAKDAEKPGIFGEKGVYGLGYGLFNMAFSLGGVIGPLWAGYLVESAGWGTLTWSFAVWAASGAVVSFFWLGDKDKKTGETNTSQQREATS
ncbi:MFS general substrate transporter [Daldinia caldariorum]|uniref:MFS general substrate transporter n=1 Tax=Daldinia caldariorum TaxID=326644 RepID=UPI0020078807|nr:MFS general substrate transporter [Daldinia caldariorum]KAI1466105.1 MFS general substrate transporter [Daldinia caldariorum]